MNYWKRHWFYFGPKEQYSDGIWHHKKDSFKAFLNFISSLED